MLVSALFLVSESSRAQPALPGGGVDVRARAALVTGATTADFTLRVSDCSELISVTLATSVGPRTTAVTDLRALPGSSACELDFTTTGSTRLSPSASLHFTDGTTRAISESFAVEATAPTLTFEGVSFSAVAGKQHVNVTVNASDDQDVSWVALDVVGLRASDLRAVGGVVDRARPLAFAAGAERLVAANEGQTEFTISLPTLVELLPHEIARDGIVIIEGEAFDASGNRRTISRLALTGTDVQEAALGITTLPARIVFTSLLETSAITPSVDFEFRGPTPLPGLGQGVTYTSSRPDLVAVTAGGVVFQGHRAKTWIKSITWSSRVN